MLSLIDSIVLASRFPILWIFNENLVIIRMGVKFSQIRPGIPIGLIITETDYIVAGLFLLEPGDADGLALQDLHGSMSIF